MKQFGADNLSFGSVSESNTVNKILNGAIDTTTGTGKITTNYNKPGAYKQVVTDFNSLNLQDVIDYGDGKFGGRLQDGTQVMVMKSSKTGPATLQIQYLKKNITKIRYE
ncbi:MAG: hypothetical protein ACK5LM_04100 [Lactovum sp.]